jgi:predicted DNA-binding protein
MALSSTTLLADQEVAKTSLRLPKSLMKRMKLYAIESEKSVTEIVIEACNEYLQKRKY